MSFTRTFNIPGAFTYHDELSMRVAPSSCARRRWCIWLSNISMATGRTWIRQFVLRHIVANEIRSLDEGAFGGMWHRTGETFTVWKNPQSAHSKRAVSLTRPSANISTHLMKPSVQRLKKATQLAIRGDRFLLVASGRLRQLPDGHDRRLSSLQRGKYPPPSYPDTKSGAPLHRLTTSGKYSTKCVPRAGYSKATVERLFLRARLPRRRPLYVVVCVRTTILGRKACEFLTRQQAWSFATPIASPLAFGDSGARR
jgi:hypothetical protein